MDVRDFDFELPPGLIAQEPLSDRASARLLCLPRDGGPLVHATVQSLPEKLRAGDLLVVNNTRVFPARLIGHRVPSGGTVECFLLAHLDEDRWEALVRHFYGRRVIRLWSEEKRPVEEVIDAIGHVPLPPYIKRLDRPDDNERYQTVFARSRGSVAAPTAGLHFSPGLLAALADRGVEIAEITLHVGFGTFQPVRVERVEDHRVEAERYEIGDAAATAIARARAERRRVIAVGSTTTRTLEAVARAHDGEVIAGGGWADLFIYPGFAFRVIDGLLTNFHLPQSSLLMLVSAFAGCPPTGSGRPDPSTRSGSPRAESRGELVEGRARVLEAYRAAVADGYRFYSYGDAMLIL